jgi:hypothetical protein
MSPIQENVVDAFTWTEFLCDTESLHNFWQYHYDNSKLGETIHNNDVEDAFVEKTQLLNWLACLKRQIHFSTGHIVRLSLDVMYQSKSAAELKDLINVPNTLRAMIIAQESRRYIYPLNVSQREVQWQDRTSKACLAASEHMLDLIATRSGHTPHASLPSQWAAPQPDPYDERRRKWHRTDDCGSWMHDDGTTWDEMEHNGMRPYDEEGDTEEEEDDLQYVHAFVIARLNALKIQDQEYLRSLPSTQSEGAKRSKARQAYNRRMQDTIDKLTAPGASVSSLRKAEILRRPKGPGYLGVLRGAGKCDNQQL